GLNSLYFERTENKKLSCPMFSPCRFSTLFSFFLPNASSWLTLQQIFSERFFRIHFLFYTKSRQKTCNPGKIYLKCMISPFYSRQICRTFSNFIGPPKRSSALPTV